MDEVDFRCVLCVQGADFEISEAEKRDLMKMRTLERKAKMSEIQRFHQAQVNKTSNRMFYISLNII